MQQAFSTATIKTTETTTATGTTIMFSCGRVAFGRHCNNPKFGLSSLSVVNATELSAVYLNFKKKYIYNTYKFVINLITGNAKVILTLKNF